jgi:hypothetical protein
LVPRIFKFGGFLAESNGGKYFHHKKNVSKGGNDITPEIYTIFSTTLFLFFRKKIELAFFEIKAGVSSLGLLQNGFRGNRFPRYCRGG